MASSSVLRCAALLFLVAAASAGGCDSKPRHAGNPGAANGSATSQPDRSTTSRDTAGASGADNAEAAEQFRDVWESHYLQGTKIGHARTSYSHAKLEGEPVVKIEQQGRVSVLRLGQQVEQVMREVSWETTAGEVRRFENMVLLGDSPQITRGVVQGDQAVLTLHTGDKTTKQTIAWPAGTLGPFGIPDALLRSPMKPGEKRELAAFLPVFNRIAKVSLTARQRESTLVGRVQRELLKIDALALIDEATKLNSIVWTDEQGNVVKSEFPELGHVTIQTTAAGAVAKDDSGLPPVDLGTSTMVKLAAPFTGAHEKTTVRYRVTLKGGDPSASFPNSESQTVKKLADGAAEVTVVAIRPESPSPAGFTSRPPSDADRLPNSLVQSDDALVVSMARNGVGEEQDPWLKARRLEAFVRGKMRTTEFSPAFGTAVDTARTLTGDCTEFAVLLCALLRASGIPARGAIGLVYVDRDQAFVYHMWTEAFIAGRWIPLDATRGAGGTSAAYLKIADMAFDGTDPYSGMMAIFGIVGRLGIEVLEAK